MKGEPTIDDVAKTAGVSRATVSRVINENPTVKPKTTERIQQAMEAIGYVASPNRPGPKPKKHGASAIRSGSIALVSIGGTGRLFQEPAMASLINDLQQACQERKLSLLLEQMMDASSIPYSISNRQVDAAIVMVTERSAYQREALANLSRELPCVQLFSPGHPVDSLDHATVNDVAIGALALRALKGAGCERFALLIHENSMHEALHVRGRAFLDRIQHENLPALTYACQMERGDPARIWPGELCVWSDLDEIVSSIQTKLRPTKIQPLGIFCAIDTEAHKIHQALEQKGLLSDGSVQLIIAGTTEYHVGDLKPRPLLINLNFPELIETTLERLIYRAEHKPNNFHTFLIQPSLQK